MARSIGSLGRKREALDLEFDYFGETLRVHPHATDEVELDFLEAGRDIDVEALRGLDEQSLNGMDTEEQLRLLGELSKAQRVGYLAVRDALRKLVHPDDFERYWRLGTENGQMVRDRMRDIKSLTEAIVEESTDFPTGRQSGSPDGPSTTPPSSEVVSYSQTRGGSDFERALALERERPDIQEFFVMQREYELNEAAEARQRKARDEQKLTEAGLL